MSQRPIKRLTAAELVGDGPVLVLSAHLDDALLSAAAVVLAGPAQVWTVFAGRPDPAQRTAWDLACGFPDSDATLAARHAEDSAAFSDTPAHARRLPCLDGAYVTSDRRATDLALIRAEVADWLAAHPNATVVLPAGAGARIRPAPWDRRPRPHTPPSRPPSSGGPTPIVRRRSGVPAGPKAAVRRLLHWDHQRRRRRAQRRGMAANPDHLVLRDLVLGLPECSRARVVLAEDLPYLWHERADAEVAAVCRRFNRRADRVEIPTPPDKFVLLQHYTSQLDTIDPRRRLSTPGQLPATETYWLLS